MQTQTISVEELQTGFAAIERGLLRGEEYMITRGKQPFARLLVVEKKKLASQAAKTRQVLAELSKLGKGISLKGIDIKALTHEGHRY